MDIPDAIMSANKLKDDMLFHNDSIDVKSKKVQLIYCKAVNHIDQAIQELELSLLED